MSTATSPQFWKDIEQRGPAFQAGFVAAIVLCIVGYVVSLGYGYVTRGGFGVVLATVLAIITTLLLPTGVGLIIMGFIVAALSDGQLSWMAAAAGPLLAAGIWAMLAIILGFTLGGLAKLLFRRRADGA